MEKRAITGFIHGGARPTYVKTISGIRATDYEHLRVGRASRHQSMHQCLKPSAADVLSSEKDSPFQREKLSSEVSSVASVGIDFEETLTCTICQSTYTDPHILSCLHSFCKSCLSKHISTTKVRGRYGRDKIKCPLCRSEHTLSAKGVDDLMPNTQLARKVENLPENIESVQNQCDQCEAANVASFCSNCENFLCSLCDQSHKRMTMFKSHVLVLPEQAKRKPKPKSFQCATHPTELLEVYCITCKSIICRDCFLNGHNGHKFKRAVEASDEIRKSLVSDSEELLAKLRTFRSHAEAVAKVEKHVTTYPEEVKAFITAQFEELHKMLEKRKETLLKEVDTQYNGFSKTLWVEKDIVETSICKLEAGIKFAQQVAKSEDKLEVAVLGSRAVTSMRQMRKLSWNSKAIENLGPVGYAAQGSDEYQEFIERIGILKNMEISVSDKGYKGHQSSHYFTKNGTYYVEVEVNFGNNVKALFPQMSIFCTCKTKEGSVSCTTEQHQQGKWEVTFQTVNPGSYTIMATLKISGEDYRKKVETITLGNIPDERSYHMRCDTSAPAHVEIVEKVGIVAASTQPSTKHTSQNFLLPANQSSIKLTPRISRSHDIASTQSSTKPTPQVFLLPANRSSTKLTPRISRSHDITSTQPSTKPTPQISRSHNIASTQSSTKPAPQSIPHSQDIEASTTVIHDAPHNVIGMSYANHQLSTNEASANQTDEAYGSSRAKIVASSVAKRVRVHCSQT